MRGDVLSLFVGETLDATPTEIKSNLSDTWVISSPLYARRRTTLTREPGHQDKETPHAPNRTPGSKAIY